MIGTGQSASDNPRRFLKQGPPPEQQSFWQQLWNRLSQESGVGQDTTSMMPLGLPLLGWAAEAQQSDLERQRQFQMMGDILNAAALRIFRGEV